MDRTLLRRHLLQCGAAAALSPLRSDAQPAGKHIDAQWFRQTLSGEAEHWLKAAATPSGFFQVTLDREWRPVGAQTATLVSQNRQIFVMGAGYELTRNRVYLDALRRGADFLLAHFRDPQYGGWFYSVNPEGKVLRDYKDCYGHSFTLFGLSHAARITRDERYRRAALDTWAEMKKNLRDSAGFFKPQTDRGFTKTSGTNSQNPMMHLFEALLALHDATRSRQVLNEAEAHANNIFTRLFQDSGGYLPEQYDAEWKPLPVAGRVYLEVGHQFEWAFLLSHAVAKGFPKKYLNIGERLLAYGLKTGYDREEGGIFSRGDYAANVIKTPKGWWEQCEFLRALMHYAAERGRTDLWEPFDTSLEFAKQRFIDPEFGGWYGAYDPAKPREGAALNKGSVWQVGYHVCGMYAEALRLTGAPRV